MHLDLYTRKYGIRLIAYYDFFQLTRPLVLNSEGKCIKESQNNRFRLSAQLIPKFKILAHLSQRLIGELIVYQGSGVRRRRRRCRCCPPFTNVFSSETAWPIKAKFYVEPPLEGGTKVYINGPGHMTKMAAMPIYGKNLKKILPQNQKSYDLETWHVASGTQALQSVYK